MGNTESSVHRWMGTGTDQDYREEVPIVSTLGNLKDLIQLKSDNYANLLAGNYAEVEASPHIMKLLISYYEHSDQKPPIGKSPQKYLFKRLQESIWYALNQDGLHKLCTQANNTMMTPTNLKKSNDFWNEWENTYEFKISSIDQKPWICVPQCLRMIKRYEAIINNNYINNRAEADVARQKIVHKCDKYITKQTKSVNSIGECPICQEFCVCCGFSSCPHTLCAACTKKIVNQSRHRNNKSLCPICRIEINGVFFFNL